MTSGERAAGGSEAGDSQLVERREFIALAIITIALGLTVHRGGALLPAPVRDVAGDALWAVMMVWLLGAIRPPAPPLVRALVAYAICVAVETSQLLHTPTLDALRSTAVGHLALGSDFDARDLLAYLIGVALAALFERHLRVRRKAAR